MEEIRALNTNGNEKILGIYFVGYIFNRIDLIWQFTKLSSITVNHYYRYFKYRYLIYIVITAYFDTFLQFIFT